MTPTVSVVQPGPFSSLPRGMHIARVHELCALCRKMPMAITYVAEDCPDDLKAYRIENAKRTALALWERGCDCDQRSAVGEGAL